VIGQDPRASARLSKFKKITAAFSPAGAEVHLLEPKVSYLEQDIVITPREVKAITQNIRWMNSKQTGDIVSGVNCASVPAYEAEAQEKLQEMLKRVERSLQESALKSWKIRRPHCEKEHKLADYRRRRTGTKNNNSFNPQANW
jgi:hypothetical protein